MGAVLGVSAAGPVAGGLWASIQSAAMTGALNPIIGWIVAPILALGASVGAAVYGFYKHAQDHLMGEITGLLADHAWVLLAHNWSNGTEIRSFRSLEEAKKSFKGGRTLRRMIVKLNDPGQQDQDNTWGWMLPWKEHRFDGLNPNVDNEMRSHLLGQLQSENVF